MVSTTGQGDLPANATIFWKSLLRKKLPTHCLSQVHFALFGLGDSSYEKFNWAARKFRKRILQLGANESVPFGEGDERHDNGLVIASLSPSPSFSPPPPPRSCQCHQHQLAHTVVIFVFQYPILTDSQHRQYLPALVSGSEGAPPQRVPTPSQPDSHT